MNKHQFEREGGTGQGETVDRVRVTTSHSFQERSRKEVKEIIADATAGKLNYCTDRRSTGTVRVRNTTLSVEFHIEFSGRDHSQSPRHQERPETVDTLRIKVQNDLSEMSQSSKAIKRCKNALQQVEKEVPWIQSKTSLSLTCHFVPQSADREYQQECVNGVTVILFDDKLRVRDVQRDDLDESLAAISTYLK